MSTDVVSRVPAALHSHAFTRMWLGSIVSSIGTQMNIVAAAWVLYRLTHSTIPLAVQGLCFSIPIAVVPLIAGPVVDRLDAFGVVKATLVVEACTAGTIALLSGFDALHPGAFYLVASVDAARLAFAIPAQTTLTPLLVPPESLLSAQSLSSAVWSSTALVGPAIGGWLLAQTGPTAVFAFNAVATTAALAAIISLHTPPVEASPKDSSRLTDGLRYVLTRHWVLALQVILMCTATLAIGVETLLPALVVSRWHASSVGYGLLRAAPGVAALATALSLSMISRVPRRPLPLIGGGIVAISAGVVLFTQATTLLTAWFVLSIASLAVTGTQIITGTHLQRSMPRHFLGVLGGLNAISLSGVPGIGAAVTAAAAHSIGPVSALLVAVVITLPLSLSALILVRLSPHYRAAEA